MPGNPQGKQGLAKYVFTARARGHSGTAPPPCQISLSFFVFLLENLKYLKYKSPYEISWDDRSGWLIAMVECRVLTERRTPARELEKELRTARGRITGPGCQPPPRQPSSCTRTCGRRVGGLEATIIGLTPSGCGRVAVPELQGPTSTDTMANTVGP